MKHKNTITRYLLDKMCLERPFHIECQVKAQYCMNGGYVAYKAMTIKRGWADCTVIKEDEFQSLTIPEVSEHDLWKRIHQHNNPQLQEQMEMFGG